MRHYLVAAAAVLVLAACGGTRTTATETVTVGTEPTPSPSATAADAADAAGLSACASLFGIGSEVPATGDQLQCKDALGGTYIVGLFRCDDGTHLGSVDPTSGAPRGWFRAPGPFHPTHVEAANDPSYATQYRACVG